MNTPENLTPLQFRMDSLMNNGAGGLVVTFGDGQHLLVDLREAFGSSKILRPVLQKDLFRKAKITNMGRTLKWPGSEDYEVSSDQVRAWGVDQAGGFSHARFIEWMFNNEHTLASAAVALGLSRRMVAYYREGAKPIPRTVALACKGWEALQAA